MEFSLRFRVLISFYVPFFSNNKIQVSFVVVIRFFFGKRLVCLQLLAVFEIISIIESLQLEVCLYAFCFWKGGTSMFTMFMHIVFLGDVVFVLNHCITYMCIGFICVMFLALTLIIICTRASNARLSTRPLAFIMFTLSSHICVGNIATHLRIICTFGFSNTSHLAIVFGNFNLWASHSFQFWSFDDSLLHILTCF